MNKLVFNYIIFFHSFHFFGQNNLVFNGDFEIYDTCPDNLGQVERCSGWWQPTEATSDYFNACSTTLGIAVPYTVSIYQEAKNGQAYCGFIGYSKVFPSEGEPYLWVEYIESKLEEPLKKDQIYLVSMSLNLSNDSKVSNKNIGLHFSQTPLVSNNTLPFTNSPHVSSKEYIVDTINWIEIKQYYVANGSENYITIGSFYPNNETDTLSLGHSPTPDFDVAYYAVDDVSIVESEILIPNVFTPNNDGINDQIDFSFLPESVIVSVENRWGNVVFNSEEGFIWNPTNDLTDGVYFYNLIEKHTQESITTGFIHLVR